MAGSDGRARKMQLLARVEQAREMRCRAVLREAEAVWKLACARAETAAAAAERTGEERRLRLRDTYATVLGLRQAYVIHSVRATELDLATREAAARREQETAAAMADEAMTACRAARDALQAVSQRSQRRTKLAETLRLEDALAAQNAEEEATADELMDRIGTAS